jgi:SOS response regulatory protein OraA/RecX
MTAKNAKIISLRLLSIKSLTVFELRKKLTLRGFSSVEIDEAVECCKRYGYLNDDEEVQRRTEKMRRRGYGPHLIGAKLQAQGLKSIPISSKDQIETIRSLIAKPAWKKKERRKLLAALQRRGFDFECILAAVS